MMAAIEVNSSSSNASEGHFESETSQGFTSPEGCNFGDDATSIQAARVVAYCVIIVISTLGNSMAIIVVWQNKRAMQKAFDFFIVNLATTDLIITLVYMPRVIIMWLRGSEWLVEGQLGSVLCKIVPFLHGVSIPVLILTLLTLAVDRFLAIVFPFRQKITVKNSKVIIPLIWFLAVAVRFPYFYSLKVVSKQSSGAFSCTANIKKTFGNDQARKIYYTFLFIVFYGLPFIVIIACYSAIVVTLRRQKVFRNDGTTGNSTARSVFVQKTRDKAARKVTYMLLTVTAAFIFSWLTYFIAQIMFDSVPCYLRFWRLFLAHINSALNPCLYAVFNEKFRHGYKRLLGLFCCKMH